MKHPYLLLAAVTSLFAADLATEGRLWWAHIQFLADDKLEGRNLGTAGLNQAVAYVAEQFERIGLKPAGTSAYLQPMKFETRQLVAEASKLALVRDGKEEPLIWGQEASLSSRG